jgi:hypothetical protein
MELREGCDLGFNSYAGGIFPLLSLRRHDARGIVVVSKDYERIYVGLHYPGSRRDIKYMTMRTRKATLLLESP